MYIRNHKSIISVQSWDSTSSNPAVILPDFSDFEATCSPDPDTGWHRSVDSLFSRLDSPTAPLLARSFQPDNSVSDSDLVSQSGYDGDFDDAIADSVVPSGMDDNEYRDYVNSTSSNH